MATGLLVGAVAAWPAISAAAATQGKKVSKTQKMTKVTCKLELNVQPAPGQTDVTPADESGARYGAVHCGKVLGQGVEQDSFAFLTSGDLQGKYKQYFGTGSAHGAFTLTPGDSPPPTSTTFSTATYTGTYTITGGTGAYAKALGKGTVSCTTQDSVHFSCTEKIKLKQL
jgi:hypothetical protein